MVGPYHTTMMLKGILAAHGQLLAHLAQHYSSPGCWGTPGRLDGAGEHHRTMRRAIVLMAHYIDPASAEIYIISSHMYFVTYITYIDTTTSYIFRVHHAHHILHDTTLHHTTRHMQIYAGDIYHTTLRCAVPFSMVFWSPPSGKANGTTAISYFFAPAVQIIYEQTDFGFFRATAYTTTYLLAFFGPQHHLTLAFFGPYVRILAFFGPTCIVFCREVTTAAARRLCARSRSMLGYAHEEVSRWQIYELPNMSPYPEQLGEGRARHPLKSALPDHLDVHGALFPNISLGPNCSIVTVGFLTRIKQHESWLNPIWLFWALSFGYALLLAPKHTTLTTLADFLCPSRLFYLLDWADVYATYPASDKGSTLCTYLTPCDPMLTSACISRTAEGLCAARHAAFCHHLLLPCYPTCKVQFSTTAEGICTDLPPPGHRLRHFPLSKPFPTCYANHLDVLANYTAIPRCRTTSRT